MTSLLGGARSDLRRCESGGLSAAVSIDETGDPAPGYFLACLAAGFAFGLPPSRCLR